MQQVPQCSWCEKKMGHRQVLLDVIKKRGWKRGAELGLCHGHLFRLVLSSIPDIYVIGVDRGHTPDRIAMVREVAKEYADRCIVYEMTTHDAAPHVPDGSLDYIFIDADHSYPGVRDDIDCWSPKVRKGGCIAGHDYNKKDFPGVVKAVDETFGKRVQVLPEWVWLVEN